MNSDEEKSPEIILTPLIDTVLVLLLVLLIAMPVAHLSVKVSLPSGVLKEQHDTKNDLCFAVDQYGRNYNQNKKKISISDVEKIATRQAYNFSNISCVIFADENALCGSVIELIDKRVSIVEAEQRVMHAKAYTLEIDQAFSLVMQVLEIVRENVRSSEELVAIQAGFQKLLKVYQTPDDDVLDAEVVSGS